MFCGGLLLQSSLRLLYKMLLLLWLLLWLLLQQLLWLLLLLWLRLLLLLQRLLVANSDRSSGLLLLVDVVPHFLQDLLLFEQDLLVFVLLLLQLFDQLLSLRLLLLQLLFQLLVARVRSILVFDLVVSLLIFVEADGLVLLQGLLRVLLRLVFVSLVTEVNGLTAASTAVNVANLQIFLRSDRFNRFLSFRLQVFRLDLDL